MRIKIRNGKKEIITIKTHPHYYGNDRTPTKEFLNSVVGGDSVEALFIEDSFLFIIVDNVSYSMLLCNEVGKSLRLPINQVATDIALKFDIIPEGDTIEGDVILVELDELGNLWHFNILMV